jgi:hypothetical protein
MRLTWRFLTLRGTGPAAVRPDNPRPSTNNSRFQNRPDRGAGDATRATATNVRATTLLPGRRNIKAYQKVSTPSGELVDEGEIQPPASHWPVGCQLGAPWPTPTPTPYRLSRYRHRLRRRIKRRPAPVLRFPSAAASLPNPSNQPNQILSPLPQGSGSCSLLVLQQAEMALQAATSFLPSALSARKEVSASELRVFSR